MPHITNFYSTVLKEDKHYRIIRLSGNDTVELSYKGQGLLVFSITHKVFTYPSHCGYKTSIPEAIKYMWAFRHILRAKYRKDLRL